jgi:iron complex outermembrane recepter protein
MFLGFLILVGPAGFADTTERTAAGAAPTSVTEQNSNLNRNAPLTEIVVTATKRADLIQNVPQSISAVTGGDLQNIGATQIEDYFNYVPGLNFLGNGQLGQHELSLRGITTGLSGSGTVGIYVDDVPFGSTSGFAEGGLLALDLVPFDLSRIEVLRGPQGTLYGSNALGGILKYVTNQPDSSKFEGLAEVDGSSVANGGADGGGKLMLNLPLSPGVAALRVSAYYEKNPGWVDNVTLGEKEVNESTEKGGRAAFLLTPVEALSIKLAAVVQDIATSGSSLEDINPVTHVPVAGLDKQAKNIAEPFKERFQLYSGTVKYDFGPLQLVSVTSYQTLWSLAQNDETATFGIPSSAYNTVTNHKFNQEFRLLSPQGEMLEWLVGASYATEKGQQLEDFEFLPPVPNLPLVFVTFPSHFKEHAVFGDLTWHLNSQWDITVGGRWNKNDQDFLITEQGASVGPTPLVIPGASSDTSWTWLVNPSFRINSNVMVYARVATGFRPGGPNVVVPGVPDVPPTFKPDKTINYEIGTKTQLLEGKATLDVSAFRINWTDIQLLQNFGGFNAFGNGGTARSQGLEVIASYRPIGNLTLGLNGALIEANLTAAAPAVGGVNGDRLPNVPRFSGAATADYDIPITSRITGFAGLSARYTGNRNTNFSGVGCASCAATFTLKQYTALDLRLGSRSGDWRAELLAKNVTNKRGELSSPDPTELGLLQPRTIAIQLSNAF